jgi:acyl dehydratase
MSLFYEDFEIGREFLSAARLVSQADVEAFADLSGDRNPIHLDETAAREAGFPAPVAQGVLGLALATGLASGLELTRGSLVALVGLTWRFSAPVYPGDRLVLHLQVASRRATTSPARGVVTFAGELRNQRGEIVQQGEFVELVKRRPEAKSGLSLT